MSIWNEASCGVLDRLPFNLFEFFVVAGPEKFDECLSFVKEHSLYVEALKLLKDRKEDYKVLCVCTLMHA